MAKKKGHAGGSGAGGGAGAAGVVGTPLPPFIDKDLNLLLSEVTTPETQVKFDTPSRSNPSTI